MLRIEFLKRLSFTTLLVAGIHRQVGAESTKAVVFPPKSTTDFLPTFPMNLAEEITSSIISKIYQAEMDLDLFLKLFAEEILDRYPYDGDSKVSNYKQLYFLSIRSEVIFQLVIELVKVWQTLCFQHGLESYGKKELESDSIQIQNAILTLGNQFKIGDIPHFILERAEDSEWMQSKATYLVSWFGIEKAELIASDPISLEIRKFWNQGPGSENVVEYNRSVVSEMLNFTERLLSGLDARRAKWHQYAVKFYYLDFAQNRFVNKQNLNKNTKKMVKKDSDFLIRSLSFESAIRTIKERAFFMQSGVYHSSDRQNQQMVVSSLVHVLSQIANKPAKASEIHKKLRLVNGYGGILSISTAAMASDSLPILEDALRILQKERKLYFQ